MHINISKVNFKSIGVNIAKVDFGRYDVAKPRLDGLYITPAVNNAINVSPNSSYYSLHGKYIKYSFDGKKWKDWGGFVVTIQPGQKMYVKGEDDYVWNSSTSGKLITSNSYYNVGGDISSLTNFITEVKNYTFYKLFDSDNYIKDASNLLLPATTLSNNCYGDMFNGCTSLTTAPALPATKLSINCYYNMFSGCTSLTTAPALPATTLSSYCYSGMFSGCTSLTTAPALPATTLSNHCCRSMFSGCTSLTTAPALPATVLSNECYRSMFQGCTSLTTAPELPATTLGPWCYYSMFQNCTSLTTAPELPATKFTSGCYSNMFSGCSSLTAAPELHATTLTAYCYQNMFQNCSMLNNITMLATDIPAPNCLNNWVNGVSSTGTFTKSPEMTTLTTGDSGIPEGWTVVDYGAAKEQHEILIYVN